MDRDDDEDLLEALNDDELEADESVPFDVDLYLRVDDAVHSDEFD